MSRKYLTLAIALSGAAFAVQANAGMVSDHHGNTGYDTAAECDAAVQNGTAHFYKSFTTKPALRRKGETSVKVTQLKDLAPEYRYGACDVGVGHSHKRDGVARELQGKYVPYSPEMPVNVYFNKEGKPVRATMKQCDNNFSQVRPRPVAAPAPRPVAAPAVVTPRPVAAPVVAAPVIAPVIPAIGLKPYVFGTLGAYRDSVKSAGTSYHIDADDQSFAGQLGVGLQINRWLGAEVFYEGHRPEEYTNGSTSGSILGGSRAFGARATVGGNLTDNFRLFGKLGGAAMTHSGLTALNSDYTDTVARVTAGVGATYSLTKNIALRADYDHYFNRGDWKSGNYMGLGGQYNF